MKERTIQKKKEKKKQKSTHRQNLAMSGITSLSSQNSLDVYID